jgi:hypothetical protein
MAGDGRSVARGRHEWKSARHDGVGLRASILAQRGELEIRVAADADDARGSERDEQLRVAVRLERTTRRITSGAANGC